MEYRTMGRTRVVVASFEACQSRYYAATASCQLSLTALTLNRLQGSKASGIRVNLAAARSERRTRRCVCSLAIGFGLSGCRGTQRAQRWQSVEGFGTNDTVQVLARECRLGLYQYQCGQDVRYLLVLG